MVHLHEINREALVKFMLESRHPTYCLVHKMNASLAESIAAGGAMAMLVLLADAGDFLDANQTEAVAVIARQLQHGRP